MLFCLRHDFIEICHIAADLSLGQKLAIKLMGLDMKFLDSSSLGPVLRCCSRIKTYFAATSLHLPLPIPALVLSINVTRTVRQGCLRMAVSARVSNCLWSR